MPLSDRERSTLRELAAQTMEIAHLPAQGETRRLWRALNACRMERPMVLLDQVCWNEMDVDGFLAPTVRDEYWRGVETSLRRVIYQWRRMPADMIVNPYVPLPRPIRNSGWGIESDIKRIFNEKDGIAAQAMTNQIHGFEDVERIRMPVIALDRALDAEIAAEAETLFAGIAPYRMTGQVLHLGVWDTITFWMGVTNCYLELVDRPELMHAVMEKMTAGLLGIIDQMNAQGLFDVYSNLCHCSVTLSDSLPSGDGVAPVSENAWSFGLAQLFTSVSPAITEEFEARYMREVFPRFGAIYYGCCDRLDDRMDVIASLPKVRKVSCSPWSERERFAERLPKHMVMSNKPTPAYLAADGFDEALVRADLRRTIACARANGLSLEFILKDISTVRHDPKRLWRWSEIAMEEARR